MFGCGSENIVPVLTITESNSRTRSLDFGNGPENTELVNSF